jgi:hypothetical protein
MQVDFSVSSQESKAGGTVGQYKESGTFKVGARQWSLCCYPTGLNDQQWMDVPDSIAIILVPTHKSQMVHVSLLLWIHTLTHGDTVASYYCCQVYDCFLPRRCEYCCVWWLETQTMKIMHFEFKLQKKFVSWIGIYKNEIWMSRGASWHWACDIQWRSHTHIVCCYSTGGRLHWNSSSINTKKHMRKCCSPSPYGRCLPCRCRMLGDMSDTYWCGESILCDGGNTLWPRSGV